MHLTTAYRADELPGDLVRSVVAAIVGGGLGAALTWSGCRWYLERTYPNHPELGIVPTFAALMNGLLIGLLVFLAAMAVRLWIHGRMLRRQSDDALRNELETTPLPAGDPPPPWR